MQRPNTTAHRLLPLFGLAMILTAFGPGLARAAEVAQGTMGVSARVVDNCIVQVNSGTATVVTSYACPQQAVAPTIMLSSVTLGQVGLPAAKPIVPVSIAASEKNRVRVSTIMRPNGVTLSQIQPTVGPADSDTVTLMTLTY